MEGWIQLHRKFIDWEWYDDTKAVKVFLHLLLMANHKPKKWHGITIKHGQHLTSLAHLAEETKLSVQNIRTIIKNLSSTGELTYESTRHYTIFSICNYAEYQSKPTHKLTNAQHTPNNKQQCNNENKDTKKKIKKKFFIPTIAMVQNYVSEKQYHFDPEAFVAFYESVGWKVGSKPMKSWQSACVTWEKRWRKDNPTHEELDEDYQAYKRGEINYGEYSFRKLNKDNPR